ncbi:flagellar motor protein MotA [Clostridia bacterium]|nr:flagellar motor protein MotA [Clostridia bacterium]
MGKKPDLTTIIGCAIGVGAVLAAMHFKHIHLSVFLNPAATLIIFVGTVAAVMNSFTMKELSSVGKLFDMIFNDAGKEDSNVEIIQKFFDLTVLARKEGLLVLEDEANRLENKFMKKGLLMVVDGVDEGYITEMLELDIESMEERHGTRASIFSSAGAYAPTLGVLGAVFGLIAAMSNINEIEMMAEAVAAAFIATILGIFTGYVLWNPFATKLKMKSKHEVLQKRMIIEGIICIQRGENPVLVKSRLAVFLQGNEQDQFSQDSKKD